MKRPETTADENGIDLAVPLETVCFLIFKAREFDAKDDVSEPDPGSNPADDRYTSILEDHEDDPVLEELRSTISSLSVDAQIDLVTLMWLGRGNYTADDWEELRKEATDGHSEHTAEYLCGSPLLADYLSNGLSALDYSCADYEMSHL